MHETDPFKVVVGIAASFSKSKKERGSTARIATHKILFITAWINCPIMKKIMPKEPRETNHLTSPHSLLSSPNLTLANLT